jgi:hypothetical protein
VTFRLSRGFTVAQVAEKHGWTDPKVWSLALEDKNDRERFKELGWGLKPKPTSSSLIRPTLTKKAPAEHFVPELT